MTTTFPKLYLAIIPWEWNWRELAFNYFFFNKRNYYFTANTQTNISKLSTESAKQVSYILQKDPWLMTKVRDHCLDSNQNSATETISIFISTTEQMLKSIVQVASFVIVIEVVRQRIMFVKLIRYFHYVILWKSPWH